jgi:hypothetical protein
MAAGSTPASGQAGCEAEQIAGGLVFDSRVCDMPDFDQRRLGGGIQGDGRSFTLTGLLDNGNCHCVPTSLTDLLGYYAHKGVDIPPGAYPWGLRPPFDANASNDDPATYLSIQEYLTEEVLAYDGATKLIKKLGASVQVDDDTCGTSFGKVVDTFYDLAEGGEFGKNVFVSFGATETGSNAGGAIASIMHNGGVVSAAYGRYEDYIEVDGSTVLVGDRAGGHAVAVSGVQGNFTGFDMSYSNPATTGDRFRQAPFAADSTNLKRVHSPFHGYLYRFGPDASGTNQKLVDKYMAFYPGYIVTGQGSSLKVVYGFDFNRQDGNPIPPSFVNVAPPPKKPKPKIKIHKTDGKAIAAAPMPMTGEIAYMEQGSDKVKAVVPGTDEVRMLGPAPAGKLDLEASPTGKFVFALGKRSVVTLSREGGVLERARVKRPAGLAYDWSARRPWKQRLGVVSETDGRLTMLDPQSLKAVDRVRLPDSLLTGKGPLQAAFGPNGRLQVRLGDGALRTHGGPERNLPGTAPGFAVADSGRVIAARNDKVDANGFPLDGVKIGAAQILAVSHTGADYSRAEADEFIDETDPATGPPDEPAPDPTPTPQPNLVIEEATGTQAVILNAGDAPAGPFTATLTQEGGPPLTFRIDGLAPGARTTITYECRRLEERTLTVDASNEVAESDETDNERQFSSTCT